MTAGPPRRRGRWNHNIHYHRLVLDAVPEGAERALDVGCGEGLLTRELRDVVPDVTGIDVDGASIDLARTYGADVEYVRGDVLTHELEPGSYDLVGSIATLHHMDATAALRRMCALLRPGGVLVVVGIARPRTPADYAVAVAGVVANRVATARRGYWEHSAPTVWPPPETYGSMRRIASTLPGAQLRRRLYFRYSLVWRKPG